MKHDRFHHVEKHIQVRINCKHNCNNMSDVKICSLNCRGLSNDTKRRDIVKKYDIIMLIDTHSKKKENEQQWKQEWGYAASFCSHTSHSGGIAILFNNTLHKEIMDKMVITLY